MVRHHAYNGIPAIRETGKNGAPLPEIYRDGILPASGHDHLSAERLSGKIEVSIRVATPTVPGFRTSDNRVVVASRSGDPGGARTWEDTTIPSTTLKGVLSSAFEAVTASRMRVFRGHDHLVTHRRTPEESTVLYPVLLVPKEGGSGFKVRVMLGKNRKPKDVRDWERPETVCAAVLPDSIMSGAAIYEADGRLIYSGAKKKSRRKGDVCRAEERLEELRAVTKHRDSVRFTLEKEKFYDTQRYIVSKIGSEYFCGPRGKGDKSSRGGIEDWCRGVVVRLTPPGGKELIDTKCNEFIFFDSERNRKCLDVPGNVFDALVEVIYSYVDNVRKLADRERRRRAAGLPLNDSGTRTSDAPSTIIVHDIINSEVKGLGLKADRESIREYVEAQASPGQGLPLFASIDRGEVTALSISQVGRRTSARAVSPAELAADSDVSPALKYKDASVADRVWGFVADGKDVSQDQGAAFKGRISISSAIPDTAADDGGQWLRLPPQGSCGWVLPTLASPKPSVGAPYLRKPNGTALDEKCTRNDTFQGGQTLVRKIYPTHRFLIDGTSRGDLPQADSVSSPPGPSETVVGSYLTPGAQFSSAISFENLTREELAVLMWLLNPGNLVPKKEKNIKRKKFRMLGWKQVGYHHLGFGKPLGLGSVELRAENIEVYEGRHFGQMYEDLSGCLGCADTADIKPILRQSSMSDISNWLPPGFSQSLAVRAFVRSAYGWDDSDSNGNYPSAGDPVSYPGASRPVDDGELSPIITWFQERERNRVKFSSGEVSRVDHAYDLPAIADPS